MYGLDIKHAAQDVAVEGHALFWLDTWDDKNAYENAKQRLAAAWIILKAVMEPPPTVEDYRRWRRVEIIHPAEEPDDALAAARMEGI